MYCTACSIEIEGGLQNCPECGTYLISIDFHEDDEGEVQNIFEDMSEESPVSEPSEQSAEKVEEDIEAKIKAIKKKMRRAKQYYQKKKISKKKYAAMIRKYKKTLKKYMKKRKRTGTENKGLSDATDTIETPTRPDVEHRSQLNFEDLYSPITEDETWQDPLMITEFESAMKECQKCSEQVRMHWLICPSCKEEL